MTSALDVAGKHFVILGVANERSLAWGISQQLAAAGAKLTFTYVNEAIERRVRPLAESIPGSFVVKCDVASDESIDSAFAAISDRLGADSAGAGLGGLVHAVAYAEQADLKNPFVETSRSGFHTALDVSAYSLVAVARRALPLFKQSGGGSIITLSYLGADRVVANYNVMGVAKAALESAVRYLAADLGTHGVRVNAISAGPVKTLAASGIPHFKELLASFAEKAPLRRNTTQEDVAGTAMYLLSKLSGGVTGETIYVDSGFNILGL
jgi:enoyl-[acyl-carrier protein] reductase I